MSSGGGAPGLSLDHVQLAAPPGCEAAARRFYGELLGLVQVDKPARLQARGGVWFALGDGRELHIGAEDPYVAAAKAHPALSTGDTGALRALAERLRGAGAPVHWDTALPGVTRFYTEDPFGNRLELLARPIESPRSPPI
ncbi:MAG: VOC family protein [Actinomycetota bacterium]|nr:VOC family protein [Actinomycetota bacterium]